MSTYRYFQDPTGGWVEVPRKLIDDLKIEAEISSKSRVLADKVYLHEDHDANVWYMAMRRCGAVVKTRQIWSEDSIVKSYDRYPENLSMFGPVKAPKMLHRKPIQTSLEMEFQL
jgi:hypothetical protein